jgi:serine/threonine-protein kinase HipA
MAERHTYVFIQLPETLHTVPAALLKVTRQRDGTYIGRFRYGDRYLERPDAVEFDPFQLPLGKDVHEFTKLKGIPGAIRDAAPDAWGRRVIEHKLQRDPADLDEIDYLLHGPQDGAGYLSFGLNREPPAPRRSYNRTHQLSDLVAAAEAVEDARRVPEQILEQLEPGTSMGGARPKATVEHDGVLWLAKFPERSDRFNLQRVEFATLKLARQCGLSTCEAQLQSVAGRDVLMLQRFDRKRDGDGYFRLGFVSALTVLDAEDSYSSRDRWSYPLLADGVRRWSVRPQQDCSELFRRMVFNAAVTNNDDHPRNHALLRHSDGWRLSPVYDVVPVPVVSLERRDLALTVGTHGRAGSLYNLVSQCGRFGLEEGEARKEIQRIASVIRAWRNSFAACGVASNDIDYIAPAMLPPSFLSETPPGPVR